MNPEYDYLFKLLVIGDSGVGKSCLLRRFADNKYTESYISTIGVDFKIKTVKLDDKVIKLQIWDTAGQTRFRSIVESFYRRTHGVCLCFDLTNEATFEELPEWISTIRTLAPENTPILLIGNKADLTHKREVKREEAEMVVNKYGLKGYIETSAKKAQNVEKAFHTMIDEIINTETYIAMEQRRIQEAEENHIVDPDYLQRQRGRNQRSAIWSLLCGFGGR
mmetsp:Transcript_13155/g.19841  ORF Transcript_13155/g.19841 Transcript_13155/m.19841 type:complete len:221 (-) Transcript_13155:57-719(-)